MFTHNFKYVLKTLFRSKALIFWTFAFPLIMGTFFKMAFSNIESSETLDIIPIALVNSSNSENDIIYENVFADLSKEGEDKLFTVQNVTVNEAKDLLDKEEIVGYLELGETPNLVVKKSGIDETIFKSVVAEIEENSIIYDNIITKYLNNHPEEMANIKKVSAELSAKISKDLAENKEYLEDNSSANLSYTMIEFYTLIAMTCLYGGMIGMTAINNMLPNMSGKGKRIAVSSASKSSLIISSAVASFIIMFIGFLLLFLYSIFVLKVDFGSHIGLVILLSLVGCLAGLSLGIFLASVIKMREEAKIGVTIAVTMLGCFFSGMMGITMKYVIDKNIPIINKLNPASMITDGLYSLYYYDTYSRFLFDIGSLVVFSLVLLGISIVFLRRQNYDSI